ncbi:MAG: hypothetical protein L0Y71_19175 [Gemmataceae bacterium]|nr:hypothetical protein [Gemmataceae bacterium]
MQPLQPWQPPITTVTVQPEQPWHQLLAHEHEHEHDQEHEQPLQKP